MSIDWIGSLWGVGFNMLKSIKFGNLVALLLSLRRFDVVYQGWFVWAFIKELLLRQASRQLAKAHQGFDSIASSLSTGFEVYSIRF